MEVVTIVDCSIAHVVLSSCKSEIRATPKGKKKKKMMMMNDERREGRGSYIRSSGTV